MRDLLEHLLRAAAEPDPERANALWADYRDRDDQAAFATLLAWYGLLVYRRAWGFLRNDAAAEDAFQAAVCQLHRNRGRLATFPAALRWWRGVVLNEARMILRARRRAHAREARAAVPEEAPAPDGTTADALREALVRLPADEREVVALVFFEGMTQRDAAKVLGLHRDTLARRLDRALGRLRAALATPAVLAAGGTVAVESMLTARPPALGVTRLGELATAAWAQATAAPPGGWWLPGRKGLLAGVGGCVVVSVAVGLVLTDRDVVVPKAPSPVVAVAPPTPAALKEETVPERNLRIFHDEVLPKQLTVIKKMVLDGEVRLESVEAFDSRITCVYLLKHNYTAVPVGKDGRVSRLRFLQHASEPRVEVFFDFDGDHRYRSIDINSPIVFWRSLLNGQELKMRSQPLDEAVAAFTGFPNDDRTSGETVDRRRRLRAAFDQLKGDWFQQGDPTRRCRVDTYEGRFRLRGGHVRSWHEIELPRWRIMPDGRICLIAADPGVVSEIAADGRRINFHLSEEWWSREPVPGPEK